MGEEISGEGTWDSQGPVREDGHKARLPESGKRIAGWKGEQMKRDETPGPAIPKVILQVL